MGLIGDNVASRIAEDHVPRSHDLSGRFIVGNLICRELHAAVSYLHMPAKTG